MNYWREESYRVIERVINENPGEDAPALRKLISRAYPFGERRRYPYKIWLECVNKIFAARHRAEEIVAVQQAAAGQMSFLTPDAKP